MGRRSFDSIMSLYQRESFAANELRMRLSEVVGMLKVTDRESSKEIEKILEKHKKDRP